ncbi:DMT family transporter [Paracoccus shanxieyensis]|uniref:EamA family transporter n=1 Tax=Paracoccus shanxieyensis TaxID=2675752 RepID=A0A6L6IUM4_9RHOB|nr:DMT family transporter [Paracoccus shanxieyensis]MTH63539.1 EamA family transporter [Paracoccus shanxieyensis]MTH86460.1 EamA family transporter [Paracoccus shanxieyensis]
MSHPDSATLPPILAAPGDPARRTQMRGIALLLAAIFTFTLMDATAKHLTESYHPAQLVWVRFVSNLALVLLVVRGALPRTLRTKRPKVQIMRAVMQLCSIGLFFTALQHIGLAEATAIMDINPVLITLAAAIFLGEAIGMRRIIGIAVALIGALIIIRPGAGVFQPAAVLPLIAAFTYATGAILTRLAREDTTATSMLWSALIGTAVTSLAVPFFWQPIAVGDIWAFVLLGVLGTIAHALLIRAFAMAEASAIAPFGYTGLIWAGLWGWLIWGQLPDLWTVIGALIIVAAGLYVWFREARAMQKART